MSWAVVVPSNRPDRLDTFRESWRSVIDRHEAELIVVHDDKVTWEVMPWFIPVRTDMIRSFGIWAAWKTGCDYVLTVDDDTEPVTDPLAAYEAAFEKDWPLLPYLSVGAFTDSGREMRGFPYQGRGHQAGVQYGGWEGVPDYDARTQLAGAPDNVSFLDVVVPVPQGSAVTGSAMNVAFRRELAPVMWQLPLLDGRYDRFGDIWAGLFAKRTLDRAGWVTLVNGLASVSHDRASDPARNLERETPGMEPNENLWECLPVPVSGDLVTAYREVTGTAAAWFSTFDLEYAEHFVKCRDGWLSLFDE